MVTHGSPSLSVSPPDNIPLVIPPPPYPDTTKISPMCVCACVCVWVHACICVAMCCKKAYACVYMAIIVCIYLTVFLQELAPAAITFDGYLLWLWRALRFPVGDSWCFWQMPVPIYCYCHCSCSPPQVCVCVCVHTSLWISVLCIGCLWL